MKIGRNDPCPCGSGKKYKKCCLSKDEAAGHQAFSAQAEAVHALGELDDDLPYDDALAELEAITDPDLLAELADLELLDPPNEAADALWAEFEAAEPEEIPALFRRGLAERALDDELAFEMLAALRNTGAEPEAWALLDELRAAWPELYQASENYYLQWQIADAIDTGRPDQLPALAAALAQWADADLDTFSIERDRLAYHGHLALVADMMRQAWPLVQAVEAGLFGEDERFAAAGQQFTFLAYLERTPAPRADDPELLAALEHFAPVVPEQLADLFALLMGDAASGAWPTGQLDDVQLTRLSLRFLGDLWRSAGVSLARGELARVALVHYIDDRCQGRLGKVVRPAKVKHKPQPAGAAAAANLLCPDRATLDRYLVELLNPIAPAYYQAVAALELTPTWLGFLVGQGLITSEQRADALRDLRRLVSEAAPIWEQHGEDAAVGENMRAAWAYDEATDAS